MEHLSSPRARRDHERRRDRLLMVALAGGLFLSILLAGAVGGGTLNVSDIGAFLRPGQLEGTERTILLLIRLPRVFLAVLVGGGLSLSGAVMQGLFRNPLVDPYILGISSGAAFGAVVAILTGISRSVLAIPVTAFAFALLTAAVVFSLGRVGHRFPLETLLLAGVAVGFFFSALISLGMYMAGESLHQVVFWIMGGLWNRGYREVWMTLPFTVFAVPVLLAHARELNAFLLGERAAESMGVDVEKVKKRLLVTSSLLVAACVSVSGVIGFVGLVVPHLVRLLGGQNHRLLLPASLFAGGVVLLWADVIARTVVHPVELPVGIVTGILGAPFFVYLLRRRRGRW